MMNYTNYSNPYMMQPPAYAPRRQDIGQGYDPFGANSFLGNPFGFTNPASFFGGGQNAFQQAGIYNGGNTMNVDFGSNNSGSSFLSNPFQQTAGYDPFGANSFLGNPFGFTNPASFFGGGQNAFQQAGIYNGGNTMNVNFPPAPRPGYEMNRYEAPRYEMPHLPVVPEQPMPQPPVVPHLPVVLPYCPPPVYPPAPPLYQPVHPPAPHVQTNYVGLAGDPVGYGQDLPRQTVDAPQNTGFHALYANGEGFAGNAAGGQLAGILNRQQPLTAFNTAVKEANASGLFQGGVPAGGIAVNSLVEQLNAKEPNKVANTQYGVTVGDYRVQLAGGLTQVIKPDGTTVTLKPDGTPFQLGNLATLRAGVTLPGAGEARTVLAYNEALRQGGTSTDLLTWGFRMPDGLGATERASAGFVDGVQRLDSNGNKTYYDFQVIQNAQANQLA